MNLCKSFAVTIASTVLIVPPLSAQAPVQPVAQAKASNADEVICQKEEVIGSRLATHRVCLTRQQWAERRLLDRQSVEGSQRGACLKGSQVAGAPQC